MTDLLRGYNKDLGYKIPTPVDPGDSVCIRVYVPRDTLYIGAFWSAYQYFTSWVAWERDAQHRAKDAAAVWKFWFDMARAEYDAEGGICGVSDIRQKPNSPCIIQKRVGGAWSDVIDMRLCTRQIRFGAGGQIEMWDGTEWIPAGESEGTGEPYDPRTDLANEITHPAVGEGQDPSCVAAINAATYLSKVIDYSMVQLKELGIVVRVVDFVVLFFIQPVSNFLNFVMAMDETFNSKLSQITNLCLLAEDDIIAYDIVSDALCMFMAAYDGDRHMTAIGFAGLISDMNNEIAIRTGAEKRKWELLECYTEGLGRVWMSNIADECGITEYECGCGWSKIFDFNDGQQGWGVTSYSGQTPSNVGTWSGSYFESIYSDAGGGANHYCVSIEREFDLSTVTYIRIVYACDALHYLARIARIYDTEAEATNWLDPAAIASNAPWLDSYQPMQLEWNGSVDMSIIRAQVAQSGNSETHNRILSVEIHGVGSNPFA